MPDPPYVAGSNGEPNWVSIYEKAAAQVYGGADYEGIEGDSTETGLELVTGKDASRDTDGWFFDGMVGLDGIEDAVDDGKPVVVDTGDDPARDDIVGNHAYVIEDVFTNADGERIIHIRNPWGPHPDKAVDLYLTEDEFRDNFEGVAISDNL